MAPNYVLCRQLLAFWFLLDWVQFAPYAKLWLGRGFDAVHWTTRTGVVYAGLVAWPVACWFMFTGSHAWIASAFFLVVFRHLYIGLRWRSLLRGIGAVGFMPYWAMLYVFFFESVGATDHASAFASPLLLAMRIDFGLIFICAGAYKGLTGYFKGEGVEYALSNPIWTFAFGWVKRMNPRSLLWRTMDPAISAVQIAIGFLYLAPDPRAWIVASTLGALTFVALSFAFRIGRLGWVMAALSLLFLPRFGALPFVAQDVPAGTLAVPQWTVTAFTAACYMYLALLPIVKVVQYTNLFLDRKLPEPWQTAINKYAGLVPIIIWRVFSVDITNFFVRIYEVDATGHEREIVGEATTYSPTNWRAIGRKMRYLFVGESVAIAAMFNTQKHFTSQPTLFEDKLKRYAKTLPTNSDCQLKFEYVLIRKAETEMEYVPIVHYFYDPATGAVREQRLVKDLSPATLAAHSPIRESVGYGSYVRRG